MLGLADDLGVRLNSGRPGAKDGPRAFRAALAKYGVSEPSGWDWPGVFDAGDITPAEGETHAALEETHRRVTEATTALLDLGLFPIGIGGGHDLTFPFVRAVASRQRLKAGVYFDAHLDVRETLGSGMPFRGLVEHCRIAHLEVHGLDPFANSSEHTSWFLAHGGEIAEDWMTPSDHRAKGLTFASFDLDVLDAAHAPGVSAMNPCGWNPSQAVEWMDALGRARHIACFDIMELNPAHDEHGRTARLAAHLFLNFIRAFADRPDTR